MLKVITHGWKSLGPSVVSARGSTGGSSTGTWVGGGTTLAAAFFSSLPIFRLGKTLGLVKGQGQAVSQNSRGLVLLGVTPGHTLKFLFSLLCLQKPDRDVISRNILLPL